MKTHLCLLALGLLALPLTLSAQAPSQTGGGGAAQPAPANTTIVQPAAQPHDTSKTTSQSNFLGMDAPFFNPGTEMFEWDGRKWAITDQRLFRARFEKYLNAPSDTTESDLAYQKQLDHIYEMLEPRGGGDLNEAWDELRLAAEFPQDANLSNGLADAIYTVWLSKRERGRLASAKRSMEKELDDHYWNARIRNKSTSLADLQKLKSAGRGGKGGGGAVQKQVAKEIELDRDLRVGQSMKKIAEIEAMVKANQIQREASKLQAKIEFQTLVVQFFMQRRFQHVVIASRFYRKLFGDGDTQLKLSGEAKKLFHDSSGLPPTLSILDSMANEAMRDVREGVAAYEFLLKQDELASASQRLAEAFIVGEYMPEIRTLSREKKRRALKFVQNTNQLVSALEVKDYARAERLVKVLEETAKDFDNSKPMAAIETARQISALHLAKARNAAASGDKDTLERELRAATEIWPRNPELSKVSTNIFDASDVQQQALSDLERLLSQKNYRQIYDDQVKYIAATALFPERQDELRKVLTQMQMVETAIIQANEIAKRGDPYGAWESIERAYQDFPGDIKLSQMRADLTTKAADFVRSLAQGKELEERDQLGSSLAWYLRAQQLYPASDYAREGIERVVDQIMPDSTATTSTSVSASENSL
ncbi:MAG: hypothetical protein AAGK14_05005 [Verrucomicrobiota bacterium]